MTRIENHADVAERADPGSMLRFVMTLFVATLIVAASAYVLSCAVLAPGRNGSAHGSAPAVQHVRT